MRKIRRKRRSLQEITTLISELERTDLSATDLARREGVAVGSVYQWKRKVRESLNEAGQPIEVILPGPVLDSSLSVATASPSGLTLVLGGIDCKIEPGFDEGTLLRLIETVNNGGQQEPC